MEDETEDQLGGCCSNPRERTGGGITSSSGGDCLGLLRQQKTRDVSRSGLEHMHGNQCCFFRWGTQKGESQW